MGKEALEVKMRIQKTTLIPGILSAIAANTATLIVLETRRLERIDFAQIVSHT
ncbi:unnamed protein product [Timema podura]|uniref:Uncharacterized protein n=1 Tax=Timema podura TaxID=61482 RepID=A0ABN7PJ35_TIMPD|nr:unnamed protein product [Timema podura]